MQAEPFIDKDRLAEELFCRLQVIDVAMERGMPHWILFGEPRFRLSEVRDWLKRFRGDIERAIAWTEPRRGHRRGGGVGDAVARRIRALEPMSADSPFGQPYRGYVYAIQCGDKRGNIKIGRARDPRRRLRELQTAAPDVLRGIAAWQVESTAEEFRLHRLFGHLHVHGEWFKPRRELLRVVLDLGGDYDWEGVNG